MRTRPTLTWAGPGEPLPRTGTVSDVAEIVAGRRVLVLSGAGLSTESGIPDYRGETGSLRARQPMTYGEFVASEAGRQRYWARSHLGWRTIARAAPNDGHRAVSALRAGGWVSGVITQNVDGLHRAAGTPGVVELHGNLDRVVCLGCRRTTAREDLDARLRAANPDFAAVATRINPDGDVELAGDVVRTFRTVPCTSCSGVLKPDVVFFGENVPRSRVQRCYRMVDEASAVLVLGSSLTVMSGLRFVRRAAKSGKPVAIVNRGQTRGDEHAAVRADLPLGPALTELLAVLENALLSPSTAG
ncbi:NAD-dependent protein deacetylase [Amycolatopsis rubida]|uniref:NAD-dependent protein deacetylase n=1 Tax=Amycolatopsis rubida TaxID=112413 RepID=A0ABX0C2U4_9PSEU|nr:NAD-dependent protein deacetylase [Amycolatopsis sp. M39]MYW94377.1 NAD-dependent protein deacetylase [Amycolatopsis rubida]NEC59366.1 NAD-dependent protein deacetylase [Amycolatopsis rubida]OAP26864.1 NAD-dependent protein deacetylase [Amycolatopsis sp. M39]